MSVNICLVSQLTSNGARWHAATAHGKRRTKRRTVEEASPSTGSSRGPSVSCESASSESETLSCRALPNRTAGRNKRAGRESRSGGRLSRHRPQSRSPECASDNNNERAFLIRRGSGANWPGFRRRARCVRPLPQWEESGAYLRLSADDDRLVPSVRVAPLARFFVSTRFAFLRPGKNTYDAAQTNIRPPVARWLVPPPGRGDSSVGESLPIGGPL